MNNLREGVSEYLELRRALGFRLKSLTMKVFFQ